MTDELVERLLDWPYQGETMAHEAADRIDALTAERDGLLRCVTDNHVALCRAEKAEADFARQVQRTDEQREAYEQALSVMEAERDRLREALRGLERASTEVASCGARTGPHWLKLTVANLSARAALKGETP